jgi:hypothetical protein
LWLERVPRLLTIDKGELKAMRTWRFLALAAVLTGVMPGTVFSADTVKVFRYDGSLQCGMGQAVPLDEMAEGANGSKHQNTLKREEGRFGFHHSPVWSPDRYRERI